ncbi:MAG: metallophosphoesterase family protein [Bdellovibrionales bacterium]|nr:metallophosphoesterase family protein [Bdellovibrionales bacterium]
MAIFFTADHHFGHSNIIKFENRPFENSYYMDEAMIKKWNEKVSEKDKVYHLGDVSLKSPKHTRPILDRLNGRIYLIRGNHDKSACKPECADRFEWIKDYHFLKVPNGPMIVLMHYCLRVWDRKHYGTWHLYGHSHSNLPEIEGELAVNVGVDCWDFAPVSLNEIAKKMEEKKPAWEERKRNRKAPT